MWSGQHVASRGEWSVPLSGTQSNQALVLAFGASGYANGADDVFASLQAQFPNAVMVGCSTSGEILNGTVSDDSLVVGVTEFEHTRLAKASVVVAESGASEAAGRKLGEELKGDGLRAVLLFSDGLGVNGTALCRGVNGALEGVDVVVGGGLAGDGPRFESTWVLVDGKPVSGHVVAVGLYGDRLQVGHGCAGGWSPFGLERKVTRSEANVLHELDGRPALDLYKEYLGERASGLPATALLFPLLIDDPVRSGTQLVRTILTVDDDSKTMTFAGDIPQGSTVRLMRAGMEALIDGAEEAGSECTLPDGPALVVAVSCVGRRLVLGELTEDEVEETLATFAPGSMQVGFYSYGEIAPKLGSPSDLHNQTMTLTAFSEA